MRTAAIRYEQVGGLENCALAAARLLSLVYGLVPGMM